MPALIATAALALALAGLYVLTMLRPLGAADLPDYESDLANGKTMFWAGGCASCHAAPRANRGFVRPHVDAPIANLNSQRLTRSGVGP